MSIDHKALAAFIKSQGWSEYGIQPASVVQKALESHETAFERWVQAGYQADMDYLEAMKEDRFHPENKLPDIESVIVLMAWYGQEGNGKGGLVARYARGRDYHKVLKKRLLELSEWLKTQDSELMTYPSVDSGPTVDRVLAEAAGIGFFGKNTNIIDPRKGSYFFIASLMANKRLPKTEKQRMPSCGDCRNCISACPTGAIVEPGVIDARRCISYLTIENRGEIPPEMRDAVGNRLFGCDVCQEVCPFNEGKAGKQEILIEELRSKEGAGDSLDLRELLKIDSDEAYLSRFAGTPLMRAKRRGLLRNACVVAGNSGDKSMIPELELLIEKETDEMIREHANWAIKKLKENALQG